MAEKCRMRVPGFYEWDEMDEVCEREGAALKKSFATTAVRGTPRRKAKVPGGPKNRKQRAGMVPVPIK